MRTLCVILLFLCVGCMATGRQHTNAVDALCAATAGLGLPSERDQPFKVYAISGDQFVEKFGHFHQDAEVWSVKDFFSEFTQDRAWYGKKEIKDVAYWRRLVLALQSELRDVSVYCVGKIAVKVYVVGQSKDGAWIVLESEMIKT